MDRRRHQGAARKLRRKADIDPATPGLETNGQRVADRDRLIELIEGIFIDVDHSTLGRLQLAGPPLRFFDVNGAEVTRTSHTAPPTLDGDGAAVRPWLIEDIAS